MQIKRIRALHVFYPRLKIVQLLVSDEIEKFVSLEFIYPPIDSNNQSFVPTYVIFRFGKRRWKVSIFNATKKSRSVFHRGGRGGWKEGRNENEGRNDLRGNEARIGERFTDTVLTSGIFIK